MLNRVPLLISILLGIAALPVPLLGNFHIESALVASVVGCFWAGWRGCKKPEMGHSDFKEALKIYGWLALFGMPLLIYALLTGCFSVHGLGFWLLLPLPSVFMGYAVGRLLRKWAVPGRRASTMLLLVVLCFGPLLFEFFNFPQVYFFNHVWGYWPGPIYDETVHLTGSLIYFRGMTFCWILLLWFIPEMHRDLISKWIIGLSALVLFFGYSRMSEAGIISSPEYIQQSLGGHLTTEHFEIFYAQNHFSDYEIELVAQEHEFYLHQIAERLAITKPDTSNLIQSYLYGHPWQKKRLVGAKYTSYVPVWLEQDQLHIAKSQLEGSLKHELVHVLAKRFGSRWLNASWSIGLVEGLAVALAPNESGRSTIHQIVVSEKPLPTAREMKQALSPLGFYSGRSNVSYITSGSFVDYLLETYPVYYFKDAYRSGSVEAAYPQDFENLVGGWKNFLDTVEVDSTDQRIARRLFAIPSLFEQACPRIMTQTGAALDRYRNKLAEHDTTRALQYIDDALATDPTSHFLKSEWSYRYLKAGKIKPVQQLASLKDSSIDLQFLYGDAYAIENETARAQKHLARARDLLQGQSEIKADSLYRPALETRSDWGQWQRYLDMTYDDSLFGGDIFEELHERTQVRSIEKAIEKERWELLIAYARLLVEEPLNTRYFDAYLRLMHHLAYLGEMELFKKWESHLYKINLRPRFRERLNLEIE